MTSLILAVCTANVCRSPVMEALLTAALGPGLEVRSAGIEAVRGDGICPAAASLLSEDPATRPLAEEHRSQPVTEELLDSSDLILCASRHQQDAIGQLCPRVRPRTFTLLQAAALIELWAADETDSQPPDTMAGLTDLLHRSRWQVTARRGERRGMLGWRAAAPVEMTVSDWHSGAARTHGAVFRPIRGAVDTVAPVLRSVSPRLPEPPLRQAFLTRT